MIKNELPGTKKNVKKLIALSIMLMIIVGFVGFRYVNNSKVKTINSTIEVLNDLIENDGSKYITLQLDYNDNSAEYTFQFYEDGRRYVIAKSEMEDSEFVFESICDEGTEYVKSNFTSGFEILSTSNCNESTFNINDSFSGFDLSMFGSNDFEFEKKGDKTFLTAKKSALTNELFIGEYTVDADVEVNSLVIISENSTTTLEIDVSHSIYGNSTITLIVEPSEVLDLPEYK